MNKQIERERVELAEVSSRVNGHKQDLKRRDELFVSLAKRGVPKNELAAIADVSPGRVSQVISPK